MKKIISWNTKGIPDDERGVEEYIAIGVDITEKQIAEESLRQQTKFLQVLIDTLPVPIFYKNRHGVYTGCNTAFEQSFGKPRDQVIGKTVYEFWPKKMAEVYYKADMDVFTSPHIQQYETSVQYADGSVHQVMFYKAPFFDARDQVAGLVGTILDITERKRSEEAFRESNQKLRLLTGLTRHDIFNQLTAVKLLLDMASDSSDIETIHKYISRARETGDQIEATIGFTRDYESFGTVSSGWLCLYDTIESAKDQVSLGSIILKNQVPSNLEIYADPIIRKVFVTILENAIRHGKRVTIIRFLSVLHENTLIIVGEDDGVGIPQQEKELLFNHGFGKNTGIGLFLSREILSITGLSIRETGEEGNGARFEISVPEGKFRIRSVDRK